MKLRALLGIVLLACATIMPAARTAEPARDRTAPIELTDDHRTAIQDGLDEAVRSYNAEVLAALDSLRAHISRQRLLAQRRGDIDLARRCDTAEQELTGTAAPLRDEVFKAASDNAQRRIIRASEKLTDMYEDAAKRYLRSDNLNAALDLRTEKEKLLAENEEWLKDRKTATSRKIPPGPQPQKLVPQRVTSNYPTTNNRCVVGEGEKTFGLRFSSRNAASVYLLRDDPSVTRIAVVRGYVPLIKFPNLENAARSYTVSEGQLFLAENINGYYMMGRMLQVRDESRGEVVDSVTFEYVIQEQPGDDTFVLP